MLCYKFRLLFTLCIIKLGNESFTTRILRNRNIYSRIKLLIFFDHLSNDNIIAFNDNKINKFSILIIKQIQSFYNKKLISWGKIASSNCKKLTIFCFLKRDFHSVGQIQSKYIFHYQFPHLYTLLWMGSTNIRIQA